MLIFCAENTVVLLFELCFKSPFPTHSLVPVSFVGVFILFLSLFAAVFNEGIRVQQALLGAFRQVYVCIRSQYLSQH